MGLSIAGGAIDSLGGSIVEGIVRVEMEQTVLAAGTNTPDDFMLIDLDNTGGNYKHTDSGKVQCLSLTADFSKLRANDVWAMGIGVILRIDGTDADIGFLAAGSLVLELDDEFRVKGSHGNYPVIVNLDESSGDFADIATNLVEINDSDLNTGGAIDDVFGDARTPAVGDIVLRMLRTSGIDDATALVTMDYRTVA